MSDAVEQHADVLIVGAGASGGVAARRLAEAGLRVIALEQGRWHDRDEFRGTQPDWELTGLKQWSPMPSTRDNPVDYPIDVSESDMDVMNFNGVGGGTILYKRDLGPAAGLRVPHKDIARVPRRLARRLRRTASVLRTHRPPDRCVGLRREPGLPQRCLARAHLAGKMPIMLAIELGIDIVDHCDDMDDEVISALAETGTFVVPSVCFPKAIAGMMEQFDPGSAQGINESLAFMYDALPKAEAAGVRILLGDDFGGPGLDHGQYGLELHTYVEDAGMAELTVICWATRNAAALLDRSDDLGTVEEGRIADLLVLHHDPSIDISAVADERPLAVIKGGEVVVGSLDVA